MQTEIAIIGAGPAGTTLGLMLHHAGIDCVVVERQSRDYVLGRIRAGVLEWTTVEILDSLGVGERMRTEGHVHSGVSIGWRGREVLSIELQALSGKPMMAYGQTEVQTDLYKRADEVGLQIIFEASDVELHGLTGDVENDTPAVTFMANGDEHRIDCTAVAGCDGYHGVSRVTIPDAVKTEYQKAYPFGWLGILSETPPLPQLLYVNNELGFALCSERNPMLSRYYVQCPLTDSVDDWSDDRFWSELLTRVPASIAETIVTGPSIEKSIAPIRSYVVEPMQWGNLYLAGDAAHIVPPTGAKGLNLAIADVRYLADAFIARAEGDHTKLAHYSTTALSRVWNAVRFSWWLTMLLHRFPDQTAFDQRAQEQDLYYLASSRAARESMAEQYVGLPLYPDLART
ncbi:MAG: 4-hydroxybenzoate 3-monooxygenase [Acidimicrobiia bacterium]|nr:4-hydroxybenzoate 3-monooxygenase [Acidimicrobiia bacterium]MDH5521105.1 4-hydroxybenzoate 3-monooxygenase [Acidimicrobiia bacterium]